MLCYSIAESRAEQGWNKKIPFARERNLHELCPEGKHKQNSRDSSKEPWCWSIFFTNSVVVLLCHDSLTKHAHIKVQWDSNNTLRTTQETQDRQWPSSATQIQSEQVSRAEVHACAVIIPGISRPWTSRVVTELSFLLLSTTFYYPTSLTSPFSFSSSTVKVPYSSSRTLLPCLPLQWPTWFVPVPYCFLNETKSLFFNGAPSWRMTRLSFISFFK